MSTATIPAAGGRAEGTGPVAGVLGPVAEGRPGVVVPVGEPVTIPAPLHPTPDTIEARVKRGALLLDATTPGWAMKVELDELIMCDCHRCVLGQLYLTFTAGLRRLWPRPPEKSLDERAVSHGFAVADCWGLARLERAGIGSWSTLADAWRAEIRSRRAGGRG